MLKSAPSRSGVAQPLARVTAQKRSYRKIDEEQVDLNEEFPTCRDFAEPSDGLEPSTPSLPCCVASSVAALSEGQRRVRGDGGMTLYHAGGIWLPLERPVSRRRFARLARDLIEASLRNRCRGLPPVADRPV